VMAQAEFIDSHRLALSDGTQVRASQMVIATGSSPFTPPLLRQAEDRLVINDDVFNWHDLPRSVAVFGAGVIGLELGQALHRLGVKVRLFSLGGGIGPIQDPEILVQARRNFQDEFYLDPEAKVYDITRSADGVEIEYLDYRDQTRQSETFDYLLSAAGRRPNIARLKLENAGLELNDKGMPTIEPSTLQCGSSGVFMAGDVNGQRPLLHEASDEGRIAGANAARFPDVQPGHRRTPLAVTFSQPQIAQIGLSYQEAQAQCAGCMIIGEVSFDNQGRARVMGVNKGLLRVYVRQGSGKLLGAEMFGPAAEHLAHLLAWSVARGDTVDALLDMPFYH
ncbi:MAG: dihydrolipoyl dehydrogenase, partial [Natronospirillum sp.]